MEKEQIVQTYFAAWNAHDAAAIVSTFAGGGTYADPTTKGPLEGDAIGANAAHLWSVFPDVSFEIRSHMEMTDGRVAAEWVMKGTNTGPFADLPPTGRQVILSGADFIEVTDAGIRSVRGYFDAGEIPRQLGLEIVVQPKTAGPFTFGTAVRVPGSSSETPGAFSVTSLITGDSSDINRVGDFSRRIALEFPGMAGFLGWVGVTVGDRMLTITAWKHPEDIRQMMSGGTHVEASRAFFGPDLAAGGWTGVFVPHRINPVLTRCAKCGTMMRREPDSTRCSCGAELGPIPSFW